MSELDISGAIAVTPVRVAVGACMPAMALAMMRAGVLTGTLSGNRGGGPRSGG